MVKKSEKTCRFFADFSVSVSKKISRILSQSWVPGTFSKKNNYLKKIIFLKYNTKEPVQKNLMDFFTAPVL